MLAFQSALSAPQHCAVLAQAAYTSDCSLALRSRVRSGLVSNRRVINNWAGHSALCFESTAPSVRVAVVAAGRNCGQVGGTIAQTTEAESVCLKQITARGQSARKGTMLQITWRQLAHTLTHTWLRDSTAFMPTARSLLPGECALGSPAPCLAWLPHENCCKMRGGSTLLTRTSVALQ